MEFGNFRPSSLGEFLEQQVNEQSEVCDVMVKVGHWKRKYHKCVLQFSPFFECLFRNDFLERKTGTITLQRGTPSSVDMALMYLYGKKPTLSDYNIADLIHLAEFFMIPNLKYACVKWLKSLTELEENCMLFLRLSNLYDFDLPNCTKYFNSHLEEMLTQETALHLTCDFVNYILTEKTFSYLRMEDRLRFLARWYKTQPQYRLSWVKKFLKMLTFEEIPAIFVDELKTDLVFGELLSGISPGTFNQEEIIPVRIHFKWPNAFCFDMEQNKLFRIDLSAIERGVFDSENKIFTDPNSPVVYIKDNRSDECKVIAFNLETGAVKEYNVDYNVETDSNDDVTILERIKFCSDMCAGYDKRIAANRDSFNALLPTDYRLIINTVFIRYDEMDDDDIKMMPKFSLKGTPISLLERNPSSEVAIVLNNRQHILIYDDINCSMTKLEKDTRYMNHMFPTERGFVIHGDTRCLCITRLPGPEVSPKYETRTFSLNSNHDAVEYFFSSNIWFRIIDDENEDDYHFQWVKHDTLLAATTPDDIEWNELPLTADSSEYFYFVRDGKVHLVELPRRMLRCHPKCPHCDAKQKDSSTYTSTSDSDYDEYDLENGGYDSEDELDNFG